MTITDDVNQIREELGVDPQGVYSNVRVRLDILESRIEVSTTPASQGILTINNLADLLSLPVISSDDGKMVYILSLKDLFIYHSGSSLTADGYTIVTADGPGRWERVNLGSVEWRSQATWYIDPSAGGDENNGLTSGTAIKTFAELTRRWGPKPDIPQSTSVTFLGNMPTSDPIFLPEVAAPNNINFYGTPTILASGTLTSYTPQVNEVNLVKIGGASGFDGYVGKRLRFTSGAANGMYTWIQKWDSGAGEASTLTPNNLFGFANAAIGDGYVIEDLSQITIGNMSAKGIDTSSIVFLDLNIVNSTIRSNCQTFFLNSDLRTSSIVQSINVFVQSSAAPVSISEIGQFFIGLSSIFAPLTVAASLVTIFNDIASINNASCMNLKRGSVVNVSSNATVCVQDGYFTGFNVDEKSILSSNQVIWGSNVGIGFNVTNGGKIKTGPIVSALIPTPSEYLKITTTTTNVVLDGINKTYAQLPYMNKASGSSVDAWAQFTAGTISDIVSAAQITTPKNDYDLDGYIANWNRAEIVLLSSDADVDGYISGFAALSHDVNRKTLVNTGSFNIVLQNMNGGSTASNQIAVAGGADLTLAPTDTVDIFYDSTNSVWRTL